MLSTNIHILYSSVKDKELDVLKAEKRPVLLCIKIKDEAVRTNQRPAIITKLEKKVAKKLGGRKLTVMRRETKEEDAAERRAGKMENKKPILEEVESDESYTSSVSPDMLEGEGGSSNRLQEESVSANTTAQEKLANAEKRLAEDIEQKIEKRLRYKTIIEENENHLKVLSKQMQDVEEAIKNKEGKIIEMKQERKEKPLLKKIGSQFSIAKSVLKKERLEDDLSVLKGQSASRRRIIQKYKTKIRYDLQILNDPSITTVRPSLESRSKYTQRPIPPCFFVGAPQHGKKQVSAVVMPIENSLITAHETREIPGEEKPSSMWSLSSVDDEANSLLAQRIQNERDGNCGPLSSSGQRCASAENVERNVSDADVLSSAESECIESS